LGIDSGICEIHTGISESDDARCGIHRAL
jgi:hypothetical protein